MSTAGIGRLPPATSGALGENSFEEPVSMFWPVVVLWSAVFATFTLPGRSGLPTVQSLDGVAMVKLAVRLMSLASLGWIVFAKFRREQTQALFVSLFPWIVFVGWAIVSFMWSPIKSVTLGQAAGQVVLLLLAFVIAMDGRGKEDQILFHTLLALCIYSTFYSVGALLLPEPFSLERTKDAGIVHPTSLAGAASLGIVIALAVVLSHADGFLRTFAIATIPLFFLTLVVAQNRTSIGIGGVVWVGMSLFKGQSFRLALAGIAVAIVGATYLILDPGLRLMETVFGSGMEFMQRGQDAGELAELSGRSEMWKLMWSSYLESPLIGHGYFMCSESGTLFVWFKEANHSAHNLYLQALVSTGLIGLTIFLFWTLHFLRMLLVGWKHNVPNPSVRLLIPSLTFWYAGWVLLNTSYLGPIRPESAVYAVMVGLTLGQYHRVRWSAVDGRLSDSEGAVR